MKTLRTLFLVGLIFTLTACATTSSSPTDSSSDYQGLVGKWVRTEGGSQLFIDRTADGSLKVGYFNPQWYRWVTIAGFSVKKQMWGVLVTVKLHDRGYPGNYYELSLQGSRLVGTYHMLGSESKALAVTFNKES